MTSQYVTEPPTSGLVELHTSKGAIRIELFAHQTPLACRNFLTLALEGFYDGLVFHRLLPGFIIQSGDPSGTGDGGESIYGSPFAIEPHSRLKFNRRGLLGMAAGEERTNESQFFLTLDAAPELQGKHTLMGRVVGDTVYTLMELAQGVELVGDRPRYPPKLIEVRVVENPFDDLQPRTTKQQRRLEERQRKEQAEARRKEEERKKRGKVKKNTGLLSFGAEEEEGQEVVLKGPKSSHDLLKDDKRLSDRTIESTSRGDKAKRKQADPKLASKPADDATTSTTTPLSATASSSSKDPPPNDPPPTAASTSTSTSSSSAKHYLTAQRAKYTTTRSTDPYDALVSFQSRLRSTCTPSTTHAHPQPSPSEEEDDDEDAKEYGASDDDADWRAHRLDAGGAPLLAADQRVDDYEVLDPRDHAARTEPQQRGKRGRDYVDDSRRYTHGQRRPRSDRHSSSQRDRDRERHHH
ncbi:related to Cyclophilin-16 [Sporisorium reilianum f. sp. reilianum]|uniref:Related to Cyclophilin-16 n=1 Tax=Sporisorium reilianum f. sp. reilianum TaxID=72559 RepID=A0A2N8UHF3_9BASI|nr:related to Cyclophilin-16 [Sporisorium reilianum f. sp. reilianum]